MKALLPVILVAAFVFPAVSFAQQTNEPLTRAEVRAQLITAEQHGLVHQPKTQYPEAAPADVANSAAHDTSGYGPDTAGSSQVAPTSKGMKPSPFLHH
ncbi:MULTISPECIES: DUF4148 domain-containing protein [Paraburkholderia]|uniref:DUF4148 domain-containing protein n=1 Tax=Paraburkholderia metrosideri TaxID=580937 RepID=A0ABW9E4K4_9BURK